MKLLDEFVLRVVASYISRDDVRDAVLAEASVDAPEPSGKADTGELLRRKESLAWMFAAGAIEESHLVEGTAQIRVELAEIEHRAAARTGSRELVSVLMNGDPSAAFLSAPTPAQRAVIKAVITIDILPGASPGMGFEPDLIRFSRRADCD